VATLPDRPFVYPILDAALLGHRNVGMAVRAVARAGLRLVQLRAKDLPDRVLSGLAREAQEAAAAAGVALIVNDRPDVARIAGAAGVHLGQADLSARDARRLLGDAAIVGVSTHDLGEIESMAGEAADYIAVGPVFATRTKKDPEPVVGLDLIRRARRLTRLPLVAIGGITAERAPQVVEAGADGIAVISALLNAPDLEAAARALAAALASRR
jgi:thiamine-phosphate pyrophosphorylase